MGIPAPDQTADAWLVVLCYHVNLLFARGHLQARLAPDSAWLTALINAPSIVVVEHRTQQHSNVLRISSILLPDSW